MATILRNARMALFRKVAKEVHPIVKRGMEDECEIYRGGRPGWVGENLPFQIKNLPRLYLVLFLFFSSGLGLPFFMLRTLLLKKNS